MERCVVFTPSPLLLNDIELTSEGEISCGWVVNGHWKLQVKDKSYDHGMTCEALDPQGRVVTHWQISEFHIVVVPREMKGGYNAIIQWAMSKLVN